MKIITDQTIINYRISLQSQLVRELGDFGLFISELQERIKKFPLNKDEALVLYEKIVTICGLYYELAFGNYFSRKDHAFKERVYEKLVRIYAAIIFDKSITDLGKEVREQIFIDMETVLKEEIKAEKNGK